MHILTFVVATLFVAFWWIDFKKVYNTQPTFSEFTKTYKFRETLYFILIITVPFLFVQYSGFGGVFKMSDGLLLVISTFISFSISFMWYRYLDRIDLFEKEPGWMIFLTFILGALFTFLVFPISDFLHNEFNFQLNGEIWNDWWYCVFGIGMVEEIVKIIPFLLILKFSKHVNEPFDYILYASVSALGFAFTENIFYLENTHLNSIYGRTMFSSVAHMFDTSIIAYGLIYIRHEKINLRGFEFVLLLFLASLAHGFYDFWLLNEAVSEYYFLTIFFFLLSIYLWITMSNNLLNISPFYQSTNGFRSSRLKYRIVNMLLTIFYFTYLIYFLFYGREGANRLLLNSWQLNVFVLLFLAFNLSSIELVRGHISMVKFKNGLLFLLPRIHTHINFSGKKVSLFIPKEMIMRQKKENLRSLFPLHGILMQRISYKGNTDCYLFKTEKALDLPFLHTNHFIIKLLSKEEEIIGKKPRLMALYGIKKMTEVEGRPIPDQRIVFLHEVLGFEIESDVH